jgi:hypothetical protein
MKRLNPSGASAGTFAVNILNAGDLVGTVVWAASDSRNGRIRNQLDAFHEELDKLNPDAFEMVRAEFRKLGNPDDPLVESQIGMLGAVAATVGFNHGYKHAREKFVESSPTARQLIEAEAATKEAAQLRHEVARLRTELDTALQTKARVETTARDAGPLADKVTDLTSANAKLRADLDAALEGKAKAEAAAAVAEKNIKDVEASVEKRAGFKAFMIEAQRGISSPLREEAPTTLGNGKSPASELQGIEKVRAAFREQQERAKQNL